ncbi:hypothetical protein [Pseudopedobacter saltans]|nr:hypothetical protein [Pseudopedobacter saltans]
MKKLILIILTVFQLNCFAQTSKQEYNFNYKVKEVLGDLNKDDLLDKVIITQDTLNENAPYRLQIFFQQPDRQFKLIATSVKMIEAQYPYGRDGYTLEIDSLI